MMLKYEMSLKRQLTTIVLVCALIIGCVCVSANKLNVYAKGKELHTQLLKKTNPYYDINKKQGYAIAHKVKLKKSTIVIYGSLSNSHTMKTTKISKHTYRLSDSVKFFSVGGEDP